MKKKATPDKRRAARESVEASAASKKVKSAAVAAGLSDGASVSAVSSCRHLPDASQFPAATLSGGLPSPASYAGHVTLARLFGTRGANWPAEFKRTPFRPGRPREMGLVSAVAWLLSSPVLGVPRMLRGIARGVRNAARRERSLDEELLALLMRLETGEITDAEFQRERARIGAAADGPVPRTPTKTPARPPKRQRRKDVRY